MKSHLTELLTLQKMVLIKLYIKMICIKYTEQKYQIMSNILELCSIWIHILRLYVNIPNIYGTIHEAGS